MKSRWTAQTFPRLSDSEFDTLCALQDADEPLFMSDIPPLVEFTLIELGQSLQHLIDVSLAARTSDGRFFVTEAGCDYLNLEPPEGVEP